MTALTGSLTPLTETTGRGVRAMPGGVRGLLRLVSPCRSSASDIDPAARVRVDLRDFQRGDTGQLRVDQAVELGDVIPLGAIAELVERDLVEVAAGDGDGFHDALRIQLIVLWLG